MKTEPLKPIRVMIVEDSPTVREFLARSISGDSRLVVVASCETAEQALRSLETAAPDVISMDIHLPGMNGLSATRRIMETRPTPIVIISRSVKADEVDATMESLRAGAVSAVEKPSAASSTAELAEMGKRVCRELVLMSQVNVIRQRFNRRRFPTVTLSQRGRPTAIPRDWRADDQFQIVGIAASTGGPSAVQMVLSSLGTHFPLPILLVQHMTASFQSGFVSWLDRCVPQRVVEARHGETPQAGCVYVAPADAHLCTRGSRLHVERGELVCSQRPSGTVLFRSMAEAYGPRAIGVLLTGMGSDGAEGLLAMRQAGSYTIVEDQSTAVVYGMPGAAYQLGAECISLPLDSIGPAIERLVEPVMEARA
jgi:two-component system chemotaxis response regulator CheB